MSSDVKTIFDPAEMESVGEKLGYGKDSKERLPWEHYLSQYQEADPKEIADLAFPTMRKRNLLL